MSATQSMLFAAGLAMLYLSFPTLAQDPPTDGHSCFCLKHEPSNQIVHGCTGFKRPPAILVTALCQDSEQDRKVTISVQSPWIVVLDGAAGCNPCPAKTRKTKDSLREEPPE